MSMSHSSCDFARLARYVRHSTESRTSAIAVQCILMQHGRGQCAKVKLERCISHLLIITWNARHSSEDSLYLYIKRSSASRVMINKNQHDKSFGLQEHDLQMKQRMQMQAHGKSLNEEQLHVQHLSTP